MKFVPIKRALVSVSDKSGIAEFARALQRWNIEIVSTGGTLKTLHDAGIQAKPISDITGFQEILDGRVKTLHPKVHAGLLAVADNPTHQQQLRDLHIDSIDLVVVNLYPFEQAIENKNISLDDAIEQIDIGGPTMVRAAAKNFSSKTVVVNPARYRSLTEELEKNSGSVSHETRFALAKEAFLHTAHYDSVIAEYLMNLDANRDALHEHFFLSLPKSEHLRYGENPHQHAALYGKFNEYFEKLHGKELSFNNIVDIQAAALLVEEFTEPTVSIIKHTNPCGVGSASTLSEAYRLALATDSKSAFGGIVCVNRSLDLETAKLIDAIFTEVIIAPEYPENVLEFLKKKKDRRLMRQRQSLRTTKQLELKAVAGGVLVQSSDDILLDAKNLKIVTKRRPTDEENNAMIFAWKIAKHVKSNAIVYAKPGRTLGIGAGQMSRFDSSRIAVMKAQDAHLDLTGSAVASDAFFPFADGLLEAVKAGATAVVQPGGSIRDEEIIKAADENNVAMLFTGIRHFKH